MCDCINNVDPLPATGLIPGTSVQIYNHSDCEGITESLLDMFLRLVSCVVVHRIYTQVGVSETETKQTEQLLKNWLAVKQTDPSSCQYHEKLPVVQAIVNKIVIYGQC